MDRENILQTLKLALVGLRSYEYAGTHWCESGPMGSYCTECDQEYNHKPDCPLYLIMKQVSDCIDSLEAGGSKNLPELDLCGPHD